MERESERLRVAFTLLPRFTLTAFAGFVDALRLASDVGDRSQPRLATWTLVGRDLHPVASSCGAAVAHTATFAELSGVDCFVVVGGTLREDDPYDPAVLHAIRLAADRNLMIVGLCTGVFALAQAGVMEGRTCCVHGYHLQEFQDRFPKLTICCDQIFIADDRRLTCAGGLASIDAAGHLIERWFGVGRARKVLPHLVVDDLRASSHAQIPYVKDFFQVHDERVRMAVFLMQQHISEPRSIETIAREVGVPPRQLERGFRRELGVSPSDFYRCMRLERARWCLGHTNSTITQVAFECGFADTSHLTRSYKARFGKLPSEHRGRPADVGRVGGAPT